MPCRLRLTWLLRFAPTQNHRRNDNKSLSMHRQANLVMRSITSQLLFLQSGAAKNISAISVVSVSHSQLRIFFLALSSTNVECDVKQTSIFLLIFFVSILQQISFRCREWIGIVGSLMASGKPKAACRFASINWLR